MRNLRDEFIRLGSDLERERDKAHDLWTWLPSYRAAKKGHGDYARMPSAADVMHEAAIVLSWLSGYEPGEEEWPYLGCPCGECNWAYADRAETRPLERMRDGTPDS